jgi:CRISPR system Cascade subunit CasC
MTTFIQLHLLTSYPPANLNRDDLGRPKTAIMGGVQRLRISSQSLKRAWRTSDTVAQALSGRLGIRTKRLGAYVFRALRTGEDLRALVQASLPPLGQVSGTSRSLTETQARDLAWSVASAFVDKPRRDSDEMDEDEVEDGEEENARTKKGRSGGGKKEPKSNVNRKTLESEQLVFYSNSEIEAIGNMIKEVLKDRKVPDELAVRDLVRDQHTDADLAMFGRMLAAAPAKGVDGAVQVAHAISVHKVAVEDDYFSAVDDLNQGVEDMGAGHIGQTEFAAGLFYLYICIDRDLLSRNLQGDEGLTTRTARALTEAAARFSSVRLVCPRGERLASASVSVGRVPEAGLGSGHARRCDRRAGEHPNEHGQGVRPAQ